MFFMALFNIVFLSAPIETTFKKANNFKNDDPTSLNDFFSRTTRSISAKLGRKHG